MNPSQKIKDIIQLSVGPDYRLLEKQQIQLLLLKLVVLKKLGGKNKLAPKLKQMLDTFVKTRSNRCVRQSVCDKHFNSVQLDKILKEETAIPISAWGLDTSKYVDKLSMSKEKQKVVELLEKLKNVEKTMKSTKPAQDISDVTATIAGLKSSVEKMKEEIKPLEKEVESLKKKKNQYDTLFKKYLNTTQDRGIQKMAIEKKVYENLTVKQYYESKIIDKTTLKNENLKKDLELLKKYIKLQKDSDEDKNQLDKEKLAFKDLSKKENELESKKQVILASESKLAKEELQLKSYQEKSNVLKSYITDDDTKAVDTKLTLNNISEYKFPSYPSVDDLWKDLNSDNNTLTTEQLNQKSKERQILKNTLNKLSKQKLPTAEQIKNKSTVKDNIDYLTFLSQPAAGKKPTGKNKVFDSIRYDTMDNKTLNMISTKKSHKKFKNLRY